MSTLTGRTTKVVTALRRAWGQGDVDALDEVLAPTYVRHGQRAEMTRDDLKAAVLDMRRAFPDLTMNVTRVVEGNDDVAFHWSSVGTLQDTYLGLPPTGREYRISGASFGRFEGDRIVEETVLYDRRGAYSSLGVPLGGPHDSTDPATLGQDALKAFHRKLVTGVTVVTVASEDGPRGLAVNAFASVSLEPPLVLVCVQKTSSTYAQLIASKFFGVSVLAADQLDVVRVFASKQERKFDHVAWHAGEHGVPLIDGACAQLEVELQDTLHASTHTIFTGRVATVTGTESPPLLYTQGEFFDGGRLAPVAPSPSGD